MSSSYLLFCTMTFRTILDDARRRLRGGSEGTKCSRTAQYRPTRSEIRLFPHSAVSQSFMSQCSQSVQSRLSSIQFSSFQDCPPTCVTQATRRPCSSLEERCTATRTSPSASLRIEPPNRANLVNWLPGVNIVNWLPDDRWLTDR